MVLEKLTIRAVKPRKHPATTKSFGSFVEEVIWKRERGAEGNNQSVQHKCLLTTDSSFFKSNSNFRYKFWALSWWELEITAIGLKPSRAPYLSCPFLALNETKERRQKERKKKETQPALWAPPDRPCITCRSCWPFRWDEPPPEPRATRRFCRELRRKAKKES